MCKDRIETAAKNTIGVLSASWSMESSILNVTFSKDDFDTLELHQNIALSGHDTELLKANIDTYQSLPLCCLYRDGDNLSIHPHNDDLTQIAEGIVYEIINNKKAAISGVSIQWKGTNIGTSSKANGYFKLNRVMESNVLQISYPGYDEVEVLHDNNQAIAVVISPTEELDEVTIRAKKKSIEVSFISPVKMRNISQRELTKAACCNLSESFETNPAVDVSYTDAITGTRQIEMLGLSSPYIQITRSNMPDVRGLSSIYGLGYIPGPWIKSIQMILGSGSVINGFESIAGQINVDFIQPNDSEKLSLNAYYGSGGRIEGNAVINSALSPNLDANILAHFNIRNQAHDNNFDGFLDMPKGNGYTLSNNYKWYGKNGNEAEFGLKVTNQDNTSGQDTKHHEGKHPVGYELWTANILSNRYEVYVKRGKTWLDKKNTSLGLQLGAIYYDLETSFGKKNYMGNQQMFYANLIYMTIIGNPQNKISIGSSFQAEKTRENFRTQLFNRNEIVPGIFGEYTYEKNDKYTIVLGLRGDRHNNYGFFITPRIHSRYVINPSSVVRLSLGRGQRTANIFAENIGGMASNRKFVLHSNGSNNPYGMNPEVAWNYGINLTKEFRSTWQWSIDAYHTSFNNQIIVDYDISPQELHFYNLNGKSYSTSLQTQLDYSGLKGWELRLAYRYNDVKSDYQAGLISKPLIAPHRAFANIAYDLTKYGIKLDYTINWQSTKRIADTYKNPEDKRLPQISDAFFTSNAQITKSFGSKYEFYFGGENIFSYRQPNAILDSESPFGNYFDASMVWGNIFGAMWYGGFRHKLTRK